MTDRISRHPALEAHRRIITISALPFIALYVVHWFGWSPLLLVVPLVDEQLSATASPYRQQAVWVMFLAIMAIGYAIASAISVAMLMRSIRIRLRKATNDFLPPHAFATLSVVLSAFPTVFFSPHLGVLVFGSGKAAMIGPAALSAVTATLLWASTAFLLSLMALGRRFEAHLSDLLNRS